MQIFSANLLERLDRRNHISAEYFLRPEFDMTIVPAIKHNSGAIGLWETLNYIIRELVNYDYEYFIFCEDDHTFTKDYSKMFLEHCINNANQLDADILLGGISWFDIAVQASKNLFWVNNFSGTQFVVIFKKFYQIILNVNDFKVTDSADHKLSTLTDKKFIVSPFISIQKEFGYSDITSLNNEIGRIDYLFEQTSNRIELLKKVKLFYFSNS